MTIEGSGQPASELTITEHELVECKRVNATGRPPVVFVPGLWCCRIAGNDGRRCSKKTAMRH